jgi:dihydrofolate synthase / folylpolyglutamate synthase
MKIDAIQTCKVASSSTTVAKLLDTYLESLSRGSILAISSKVVALCEGRTVAVGEADKIDLIRDEAELFLPPETNRYGVSLAIKNNTLIPSAGIDESNSDGNYVLWPKDPQASANSIREYLVERFDGTEFGVIVTDSTTSPLRWGVTGISIGHSGFAAIRSLIGTPDLYGRLLKVTKVNVADALAAAAVLVMGEGAEQTPMAVISDVPFVEFQNRAPTGTELEERKIPLEDDLYGTLLTAVPWQKGNGGSQR